MVRASELRIRLQWVGGDICGFRQCGSGNHLHQTRRVRIFVVCLAALAAPSGVRRRQIVASCSLVPGWRQEGAPRHFTADNLYEYMDGNSESYLSLWLHRKCRE